MKGDAMPKCEFVQRAIQRLCIQENRKVDLAKIIAVRCRERQTLKRALDIIVHEHITHDVQRINGHPDIDPEDARIYFTEILARVCEITNGIDACKSFLFDIICGNEAETAELVVGFNSELNDKLRRR